MVNAGARDGKRSLPPPFGTDFTVVHRASRGFTVSMSRAFPSVREAIHATATTNKTSMKDLAPKLDWSPSELSMRTTLGGDSARPFPADDEHLVQIMKATQDYSILFTLADLCGFEVQPKKERVAEMVMALRRDMADFLPRVQMLLEIPGFELRPEKPTKGRAR